MALHRFLHGDATHPDWRVALALASAQIEAQRREQPRPAPSSLGWVYLTDHYSAQAAAILAEGVISILPRTLVTRPFAPMLPGALVMIGLPALRPNPHAETFARLLLEEVRRRER